MKNIYFILMMALLTVFVACREESRFEIGGQDKEAPAPPEYLAYKPLVGGARIYYNPPRDRDVLSVDAEYRNDAGKKFHFSASYFVDSLDVMGIADTLAHIVDLYSVDRAGNKSSRLPITVNASESALTKAAKSVKVIPSFNSFIVTWDNELKQTINVYVDMVFDKAEQRRELTWVLTSRDVSERQIIDNITLAEGESLSVGIRIGDTYGNMTAGMSMGKVRIMDDEILLKEHWRLPSTNDSIAGIPMCFGDAFECKVSNVIDGIISRGEVMNIMHTASRGRTGNVEDGNAPWNFLIDLGDYYELSRIVTNQRHDLDAVPYDPNVRGYYYQGENVNRYNMYFLNDETGEWEYISQHTILVPVGLSELEFAKTGAAGDMALMYPEAPAFTKPARWFRYEALTGFGSSPLVLSEITLYGKKTNK